MKIVSVQLRSFGMIIGCCFLMMSRTIGQSLPSSTDLKQIVTPSPNAAALGQYGNVPVGLYTGSAQISVPLYEVKEGALTLPVSLSYNSGGFRVADFAPWTGLGWTLNAGGAITRTVYQQADERGIVNAPYSVPVNPTRAQEKAELMGQDVDFQPDVFYFNFNGKSGKFMLTQTSVIAISPHQNLKIQAYDDNGAPIDPPFKELTTLLFRITDENGIVYEFKDYETNRTVNFDPSNTSDPMFNQPGVALASINAWYLTDMYSPTGDTIRFLYGNYGLTYDLPSSEQRFILTGSTGYQNAQSTQLSFVRNATRSQNQNKRLQQILFSNGSLVFNASQPRADLIGDTVLNRMMVLKNNGTPLKGYSFQYKYSTYLSTSLVVDTTSPPTSADNYYASYLAGTNNSSTLRLMLTGVSELDNNYTADGRNYSFDYDVSSGSLPSRFSKARDYWGYFNHNSDNENDFLDYQVVGVDNTAPSNYQIVGKEPDSNYCGQNVLTRITYPTGGYSQMNYEIHQAYVGRGVLPPEVKNQIFNMPIDFPSYGNASYATSNGYTDTLINGVHCYYKTFLVNTSGSGGNINISISNMMYQGDGKPVMKYDIYDSANQAYLLMWDLENNSGTQTTYVDINSTTRRYTYTLGNYFFPNGVYKVIFTPNSSFIGNSTYLNTYLAQPNCNLTGWANLIVHTDTVNISRNIGGLRVKSILDYDPVSNKYTKKNYSYTLVNDTLSSGELVSGVNYIYPLNEIYTYDQSVLGGTLIQTAIYNYIVINSESNYALSTTQGSNVGYSTVTVTETDAATGIPNGKSEYHYTSPKNYPDYYGSNPGPANTFPFVPVDSRDWQRGLLLQKIDYQYSNGQFTPIRYENNTYSSPVVVNSVNGYITRYQQEYFPPTLDTTVNAAAQEVFAGEPYNYISGYMLLQNKSLTSVENGVSLTTTESYTYGDAPGNMLPTSIASTDSKGDTITTHLTYPLDYTISSPATSQASGILDLQQAHVITPVIERSVQKTNSGGANIGVVSAVYSTFKPTKPLMDTVFRFDATAPVTNYTPVSITDNATSMDSHYTPVISFGSYDNKGNLLQQNKVAGISMAYLWDYQARYPVAEVKNALPADIAYTSFEADGTGNWTVGTGTLSTSGGITGSNYYALASGATISKSGLSASRNYVVTYWSKTGPLTISGATATSGLVKRGWTFYQHTLPAGSTSVSISGTGITIDELRLYPADAQMNTYTYLPLVGMSAHCTANNLTTYYEYDGLARLLRIKDVDGNVIKQYDYQYQVTAQGH